MKSVRTSLTALFLAVAATAAAGTADKAAPAAAVAPKEESIYDKIWSLPTLYKNEESDFIQEFSFVGRYMGQYAIIDGDREWDGWENREIRAGAKVRFLHQFELEGQVNLNTYAPHLYDRITTASLSWKPSDAFNLTLGKQVTKFTYEGSVSTTQILTFERSLVTSMVWPSPEYITGAVASGKVGNVFYQAGIFSGDQEAEFSQFNAGVGELCSLGYDFSKSLGMDKALVRADWFHNDGNAGNTAFRHFTNSYSLNSQWQKGKLGLNTDLVGAEGQGTQSDFWGFILEPSYNITPKFQVVARYTFADSADVNGLNLQKRYEQKVATGKGDQYQAGYLGFNYYLYSHKLKLMTGVEYSSMKDSANDGGAFNGWTWLSGIRMYF